MGALCSQHGREAAPRCIQHVARRLCRRSARSQLGLPVRTESMNDGLAPSSSKSVKIFVFPEVLCPRRERAGALSVQFA
jgi:hypothetical protein